MYYFGVIVDSLFMILFFIFIWVNESGIVGAIIGYVVKRILGLRCLSGLYLFWIFFFY